MLTDPPADMAAIPELARTVPSGSRTVKAHCGERGNSLGSSFSRGACTNHSNTQTVVHEGILCKSQQLAGGKATFQSSLGWK